MAEAWWWLRLLVFVCCVVFVNVVVVISREGDMRRKRGHEIDVCGWLGPSAGRQSSKDGESSGKPNPSVMSLSTSGKRYDYKTRTPSRISVDDDR